MRTAIYLIFLALTDIAKTINNLAGKTSDPIPNNVASFLAALLFIFLVMDILEFFKKLEK